MRQKQEAKSGNAEKTVRDIRRATRRRHSSEEKIRIVLEGLRGEDSIAELCRREGLRAAREPPRLICIKGAEAIHVMDIPQFVAGLQPSRPVLQLRLAEIVNQIAAQAVKYFDIRADRTTFVEKLVHFF